MAKKRADPFQTFREETRELLEALEHSLIYLEDHPESNDDINTAFRCLHTIKGSGTMFGFEILVNFTHQIESIFDAIRSDKLQIDTNLVTLTLRAKDIIGFLVTHEPEASVIAQVESLLKEFKPYFLSSSGPSKPTARLSTQNMSPLILDDEVRERAYRIQFHPKNDLFRRGTNPLLLLKELKDLGETVILGFSEGIPPLDSLDPESFYLSWDILLKTSYALPEIQDVFLFIDDDGVLKIEILDDPERIESQGGYKKLGEILVARGLVDEDALISAIGSPGFLGEILVQMGLVSPTQVESALAEQTFLRETLKPSRPEDLGSGIKVRTEKLEELANLVGEFVSLHARIGLHAEKSGDQDLRSMGEHMDGLVRQFRDLSISMHMVPIGLLFSGFRRLVRDVTQELGKDVHLIMEGTETELDKTITDALKDPLLHLIRNSLDHGIEPPEVRKNSGKNPQGTLKLSAYYSGASVMLEIQDDGQGIDPERIRSKAVERGLMAPEQIVSASEVLQFIFAPGFSTAEATTNLSGRGVGMDVVKRNIENLKGSVKIDSKTGQGTRVSLRIPLTLAIVEGLLARIGTTLYLVNLSYITECLDSAQISFAGKGLILFRGSIIPLLDLRTFFGVLFNEDDPSQILVVTVEDQVVGLWVNAILDPYQSIVKSLGPLYENALGVGGAIILGDGTPALMLDVDRLLRLVKEERLEESTDPWKGSSLHPSDESKNSVEDHDVETLEGLLFRVGSSIYGVNIKEVEEVLDNIQIVPIPRTPEFLLGIINLRGRIVPVIDLALRLGIPSTPMTEATRLLVLEIGLGDQQLSCALRVDGVEGIVDIPSQEIGAIPTHGGLRQPRGLKGLVKGDNSQVVILLDPVKILPIS